MNLNGLEKWVSEFNEDFIGQFDKIKITRYFVEVILKYTEPLGRFHNNILLLLGKYEKLVCYLNYKENYVMHLKTLT